MLRILEFGYARPLALASVAVSLLVSAACRDSAEGDAFQIAGKLFVFNYRVATAVYLVNLKPMGPVEDGQTAVATFEDPAGGKPILVRQKIWPKLDKTTIESPPLRCVIKDHPYAVTITIEKADGSTRQTIKTTMTSSENQSILPDEPLVVGPAYTPNPDLEGHPDGKVAGELSCPSKV